MLINAMGLRYKKSFTTTTIYFMAIGRLSTCTMLRGLLSVVSRGTVLENVTAVNSNSIIKRSICNTTPLWKKKMPDRPAPIDEADFTEVFLHGSGPGGQKIVSLPAIASEVGS